MDALNVDTAQVTEWRNQRFNWKDIAGFLGTDARRLRRWRVRVFFVEPLDNVEDDELDAYVRDYIDENPTVGEISVDAYLAGVLMLNVTRACLRASLQRVGGQALIDRREQFGKKIVRRTYQVGGPHRLWHVDGMHKLIRYGLIVHGCVDGFSRRVIWMHISTNNRKATQLEYFEAARKELGITPSRMRGDLGGENNSIADRMIYIRGFDRGSFIFGTSRNNVRIERHWRDLRREFTQFWMTFLKQLERERILDYDDDIHLFLVQYLFAPRMQEELNQHRLSYNNHKLSTEGNLTPIQLCEKYKDNMKDDPVHVGDDYGEYDDEDDDDDVEGNSVVNLDPRHCPLNEIDWLIFQEWVTPVNNALPKSDLRQAFIDAMELLQDLLADD